MKTYGGVNVELHAFLTSALDGHEWSASRRGCFSSKERDSGVHLIGGWVGSTPGLNATVKWKKSLPLPEIESRSSNP